MVGQLVNNEMERLLEEGGVACLTYPAFAGSNGVNSLKPQSGYFSPGPRFDPKDIKHTEEECRSTQPHCFHTVPIL
jgi:hypothetical protein